MCPRDIRLPVKNYTGFSGQHGRNNMKAVHPAHDGRMRS